MKSALQAGILKIIGTIFPLIPFFIGLPVNVCIPISIIITLILLSIAGSIVAIAAEVSIMKKVIIIYFSRTGNTKTMAQLIHEELAKSSDIQVDIQTQIVPDKLTQYDAILIGAPTYHHRMTQTISTLLEDAAINEVKLEGKLGAAFGSFGWSGEAPRLVLEVMENIFQMNVIKPPLLIKYVPRGDGPAKCQEFGARVIQELQKL